MSGGGGGASGYDPKKGTSMDGVLKKIYRTESNILSNIKHVETDKQLLADLQAELDQAVQDKEEAIAWSDNLMRKVKDQQSALTTLRNEKEEFDSKLAAKDKELVEIKGHATQLKAESDSDVHEKRQLQDAVTRAKAKVKLFCTAAIWKHCMENNRSRTSGLSDFFDNNYNWTVKS